MRRRVNVRGIIINENGESFLPTIDRHGKGRNFWCTPGGGLKCGESLLDGLRREMIETGVEPETVLLFVEQFAESGEQSAHGPNEQLEFFFITNWQDYQHINLEQHRPARGCAALSIRNGTNFTKLSGQRLTADQLVNKLT